MTADAAAPGSVSAWGSVFNIANCAIGAGILSFPYAMACSGLLGGILLCLAVAGSELYTLHVLTRMATAHRAITYQGLIRNVLGEGPSHFMSVVMFGYLFGSCVAYQIIVGDTFSAIADHAIVTPYNLPEFLGFRQTSILLSGIIILYYSVKPTMGSLEQASTYAVLIMLGTVITILIRAVSFAVYGPTDPKDPAFFEGVQLFRFDSAIFSAMPIMIFAYHCHVQSVPIYDELDELSELKLYAPAARLTRRRTGNGDPLVRIPSMERVLAATYLLCTVLYLTTGVSGYLLFPTTAESNILNSFDNDDVFMQFVRGCVGVAIMLHYPINQHVARSAVYDLIWAGLSSVSASLGPRQERPPHFHLVLVSLGFFAATTATACAVEDLGVVFQLVGGVAGSLLIFVLPGALLAFERETGSLTRERHHENLEAGSLAEEHRHVVGADEEDVPLLEAQQYPGEAKEEPPDMEAPAPSGSVQNGHARGLPPVGSVKNLPDEVQNHLDQPAMGWFLLVVGVCVIVLSVWTTLVASHS